MIYRPWKTTISNTFNLIAQMSTACDLGLMPVISALGSMYHLKPTYTTPLSPDSLTTPIGVYIARRLVAMQRGSTLCRGKYRNVLSDGTSRQGCHVVDQI